MKLTVRKYAKEGTISFKATKSNFGGLSNMSSNFPVFLGDLKIRNIELLYQALRFPEYPALQYDILQHKSPMLAKKLSREYDHLTRPDWEYVRFRIMKFCIQLKYYHNKKLFGHLLLSTKDNPIVEFTYKDKLWGVTDEGDYYEGTNALGRLLMELRDNIKNNKFELEIPKIYNLKILNVLITEDNIITKKNNHS